MTGSRTALIAALVAVQLTVAGAVLWAMHASLEGAMIGHAERLMRRTAGDANRFAAAFLRPAAEDAAMLRRMMAAGLAPPSRPDRLAAALHAVLDTRPAYAGLYHGAPDGDFVYVSRTGEPDAPFSTKIIAVDGLLREMTVTRHGADFAALARETPGDDGFDPRTRPWYVAAREADGTAWTDPYIFFSSRRPGITVSEPAPDGGAVGIDLEIEAISAFLDDLDLTEWGSVAILSREGRVIAHRDALALRVVEADGTGRFAALSEMPDMPLREAVAALPGGLETVTEADRPLLRYGVDGEAWLAVFEPLEGGRAPWIVVSYLPESDFLGALGAARGRALAIAGALAALSAVAGWLIAGRLARRAAQ